MHDNRTHRIVQLGIFFVIFLAAVLLLLEPVFGVLWLLSSVLVGILLARKYPDVWVDETERIAEIFGGVKKKIAGSGSGNDRVDLSFTPEYALYRLDHNCEQEFPVTEETCVIGRGKKCSIRIGGEDTISREHCKIIFRKYSRDYYIEDMQSKNGTYVGTRRLEPYTQEKLMENDELTIGGCRFKFIRLQGS